MSSTETKTESELRLRGPQEGRYGRYHDPVREPAAMRRIVAENCAMNPGAAAVLLQIASKGVGQGVADHSSFTKRPVERARRSMFYIYVMTFGTPEERRVVTDATHRAHSAVHKAGAYDANDVELQLWVAATMYWSLVLGYEEVYGKLDDDVADQVYEEFSVMATGLRVPPDKWPKDRNAFQAYWDDTLAKLEITEDAKKVALDVLYPKKNLPWGLWLYAYISGPFTRTTTTELLPERPRNEFGFPSTLYTQYLYWFMSMYNRTVYPALPDSVRHFLKNHYMADFRKRVESQRGKPIIKL
ncbi:hypothetical protein F5Y15DRAFT_431204 [Xylariaceae sp. FL0016]|nr:hypothetical protein F5Y15DRAFT_431204 [Xylariaceae sp. FL0016]